MGERDPDVGEVMEATELERNTCWWPILGVRGTGLGTTGCSMYRSLSDPK